MSIEDILTEFHDTYNHRSPISFANQSLVLINYMYLRIEQRDFRSVISVASELMELESKRQEASSEGFRPQ